MKRAVEEPRLHNQLLPNTTTLEKDVDKVKLGETESRYGTTGFSELQACIF